MCSVVSVHTETSSPWKGMMMSQASEKDLECLRETKSHLDIIFVLRRTFKTNCPGALEMPQNVQVLGNV